MTGAAEAVALVDRSVDGLSTGVANTIQTLFPNVVVRACSKALAGGFLLEKGRLAVKKKVFDVFSAKFRIEASQISGDDAGWLGAALWAARKFETREIREPTPANARSLPVSCSQTEKTS